MLLTYDFLKLNVVEVEVKSDISMGDYSDFVLDNPSTINVAYEEEGEAIIVKGTKGTLKVQPYNGWYEMEVGNDCKFDLAFDEDINKYFNVLKVIGINKHFVKEEA